MGGVWSELIATRRGERCWKGGKEEGGCCGGCGGGGGDGVVGSEEGGGGGGPSSYAINRGVRWRVGRRAWKRVGAFFVC